MFEEVVVRKLAPILIITGVCIVAFIGTNPGQGVTQSDPPSRQEIMTAFKERDGLIKQLVDVVNKHTAAIDLLQKKTKAKK